MIGTADELVTMLRTWRFTTEDSERVIREVRARTMPFHELGDLSSVQKELDDALERNGFPSKFEADVCDVFENARRVLLKKHQDYGPTNISRSPGGPLNGLRVRMWDKLARVNNLIESGAEPENESLRDSFLDLMNYAAIAQVVLDGNWPEQ